MGETEFDGTASPWLKPPGFAMDVFRPVAQIVTYQRNVMLYQKGDPGTYVYAIISGRVEHFLISSGGVKKIIGISVPGCLAGEFPLFDSSSHFCSARTCASSTLYRMAYPVFEKLVEDNPQILQPLIRSMAYKARSLHTMIELSEFYDATAQVARILRFICKDYSQPHNDELLINLTFTHSDIAYLTGLSRVSVSNAFSKMIQGEALRKEGNRYYIKSMTLLEALCDPSR